MTTTILIAIAAFLVITLVLVALLLYAKAKLVASGEVTIDINNGERVITTESGSTLLSTLADNKVFLPSACGGGGSCGMCKCQVLEGGGDILPTETGFISRKLAKDHWRLGCQVKVKENLKIRVPEAVLGVKKWECTVVSNRNISTFLKEFVVKLPEGEHLKFRSGGYIQIDIPKYDAIKFSDMDIDERYRSRFNSGGTFDIQPPEIETKLGIVKSFVDEYRESEGSHDFNIPDDIQMYIAESSSSNIRELKSAVTKVIYQMTFFNQPDLKLDDVRTLLENHFTGGPSKRLTIADIQKEVENFYKVSHADLVGKKRTRNIIYARQIAIYLCRQMLDLPFNDIGKKFNRDHSTVMYSVTNVEEKMKENRELREELEALRGLINEM